MSATNGSEVPDRPAPRRRPDPMPLVEGPVRASAYVCEAVSCLSAQSHDVLTGLGARLSEAGTTDVAIKRVGCLGLCAAGPLVQIPETGELFAHVRPDGLDAIVDALAAVRPGAGRVPEAAFFTGQMRIATENSGRVDPENLEDYVASGGYTALHTVLTTMTPTAVREEIDPQRPPGARRRRLSNGSQVEHRGQGGRHASIRHLQCGRGRPGRLHGPQRPGERPVPGPGGDGHRGVRGGCHGGLRLLPRGVSPGRRAGCARPSGMRARPATWARPSWTPSSRSRSMCALARALSCAARRQRSSPRSREAAARPGRGRHIPRWPACGDAPRSSTTWRRSPTSHPSSAMAATGSRASAPGPARAPRSSRSRAGSSTQASSRFPWGRRCVRSCSISVVASSAGAPSRRSRRVARPVAASLPSSWTCPWTTSRSSGSVHSWARAA